MKASLAFTLASRASPVLFSASPLAAIRSLLKAVPRASLALPLVEEKAGKTGGQEFDNYASLLLAVILFGAGFAVKIL
ncbi:hypothetical protein ACZ91_10945 [Streptomyces regensis]|nr:hypothetical protein ACZ91_10945 [Streptomyces regensis]KOG61676.1 hypothetical protein ADK77_30765 [Streptomyces antibioticus]